MKFCLCNRWLFLYSVMISAKTCSWEPADMNSSRRYLCALDLMTEVAMHARWIMLRNWRWLLLWYYYNLSNIINIWGHRRLEVFFFLSRAPSFEVLNVCMSRVSCLCWRWVLKLMGDFCWLQCKCFARMPSFLKK